MRRTPTVGTLGVVGRKLGRYRAVETCVSGPLTAGFRAGNPVQSHLRVAPDVLVA